MVKVIVVDLDGTLLTSKKKVSDYTKSYLLNLKNAGYKIVIATGRFFGSALKATDGARFADYVICDNGALIFDMKKKCALFRADISEDSVCNFLDLYKLDYVNQVDISHHSHINRVSEEYFEKMFFKVTNNVEEVKKDCKNVFHMEVYTDDKFKLNELYNKLSNEMSELDIHIMQDSYSDYQWIQAMKKGCSKFNAISYLMNCLDIDIQDVLAFGDGLNDIEMINGCGIGVAISSALDGVKEVADYVTSNDNDNDGIVKFLEDFLNK